MLHTVLPNASAEKEAPCKCCRSRAALYGAVDFHHHYSPGASVQLPHAGIPISYYRCLHCGLIFSTAFDRFSQDDFKTVIYNEDYVLFDPDFEEKRPQEQAAALAALFADWKDLAILDYGSGNGRFAHLLRCAGFTDIETYDPFYHAAKPQKRYECITCFEVVEHSPTPLETFEEMAALLAENGILIFSTVVQPATIDALGLDWWYVLPRNGHVSLYSPASLQHLARLLGFHLISWGDQTHIFCRKVPAFARHFIPDPALCL